MSRAGFTLVEVVVAVAIMAVLLAIAVPNYRTQLRKTGIERQTKELHFALLEARAGAVARQAPATVLVTPNAVTVNGAVRKLSYPITWSGRGAGDTQTQFSFDERGTFNLTANTDLALCVPDSLVEAQVDAVVLYGVGNHLGKLASGGVCASANVAVQ